MRALPLPASAAPRGEGRPRAHRFRLIDVRSTSNRDGIGTQQDRGRGGPIAENRESRVRHRVRLCDTIEVAG